VIGNLMKRENELKDIVGIGFGPSNIAIAIAIEELKLNVNSVFLEKQEEFGWHTNMLFEKATMQVSFFKDLVTLRNPTSNYSFLNFLKSVDRLSDFSNLGTFCPSRKEFNQYLSWCAKQFQLSTSYGQTITGISSHTGGNGGVSLRLDGVGADGDKTEVYGRSVVYSGGLNPRLPAKCEQSSRIFHSSRVIEIFSKLNKAKSIKVVVVGAGQSAAETVQYLHDEFPLAEIVCVTSGYGYMPADDSSFVNQIFDSEAVDSFYNASDTVKQDILRRHSGTNYAAVDVDLIDSLFQATYADKVDGKDRIKLMRVSRFDSAKSDDARVSLNIIDNLNGETVSLNADYLVCATGYSPSSIEKILSQDLLNLIERDERGSPKFTRNYQLKIVDPSVPPIFCLGMTQSSHGLTSTLISNMAERSGEVVGEIVSLLNMKIEGDAY